MKRPAFLAPAFAALALVTAGACGSDTENPPPNEELPCEATQAKLCKRACGCGGGVGCTFRDPGLSTVTFPSEENCKAVLVGSACNDNVENGDFVVCQAAIEAAECTPDDNGVEAIERPAICKPTPIGGTGGEGGGG